MSISKVMRFLCLSWKKKWSALLHLRSNDDRLPLELWRRLRMCNQKKKMKLKSTCMHKRFVYRPH